MRLTARVREMVKVVWIAIRRLRRGVYPCGTFPRVLGLTWRGNARSELPRLVDSLTRPLPAVRYEKRITQTKNALIWDQLNTGRQSRRACDAAVGSHSAAMLGTSGSSATSSRF